MKYNNKIFTPILKSACFSIVAILLILFFTSNKPQALLVNADIRANINLNDDNLVSVVQHNTDTSYLHKLELINNHITIQIHFETMVELVEKLNNVIDEYSNFYLNTINNVEYLTLNVSSDTTKNLIYTIKISKLDYLAGKTPEIIPLGQ